MSYKKGVRSELSPAEKLKYRIPVNLCTQNFYRLKAKAKEAGMSHNELARHSSIGGGEVAKESR
jgi:hypothetical protein